ncbi:single-stranded DNA-binding protein, partial [Actinopolymorpha sp. B17G11]|uniref:single-stranded DNA-binding protein n=1 Tax=Actinopolymorpha sp. B17G11 TaxID=3160861 RepID=UPI0032E3F0A0
QRPVRNPDEGSNNHMNAPNPHRPRRLPSQGHHTAEEPAGVPTTGACYARFTVASTPRRYDQASGGWVDGDTLFMRCTAWRDLAEHAADTLTKGHRVIATGRVRQSSWETPEGEKRSAIQLDVEDVGPSLRWATAKVTRIARASAGEPAPQDPWGVPAVPNARRGPNGSVGHPATAGAVPSGPDAPPPF